MANLDWENATIFGHVLHQNFLDKLDQLYQCFIFQFILEDNGGLITVQTVEIDNGNPGYQENIMFAKNKMDLLWIFASQNKADHCQSVLIGKYACLGIF